jgi:hypothetical protein
LQLLQLLLRTFQATPGIQHRALAGKKSACRGRLPQDADIRFTRI